MDTILSRTARVVRFSETGGPEVLKIESLAIPAPAAHEVRIQVKAIGLNRADVMFRTGFYVETPILPSGLGYEASGIIEAVGSDVTGFEVGDAVSVVPAFSLHDYNTYGELILVPAYTLQKHPSTLSFEEAASIWTSFLSMYGLLIDSAKIQAGQSVIITAASSSSGLAAIQFVNMLGGVSIAVTRTNEKKEALIKAGAAHVIVTEEQELAEEVLKITDGKGADIILDPVGGPLFSELIAALADRGQVFIYGALSSEPTLLSTIDVLTKCPTIKGYTALDLLIDPVRQQAAIQFIYDGVNQGKLKPIIAKSFTFDQIVEAHGFLESNQQLGKVVITL
jgi:NADPH:quinone reductase-like Zn-dependent oxidoreductase